jgi:hypothetical protein
VEIIMNSSIIPISIIIGLITFIPLIVSFKANQKVDNYYREVFEDTEFKVSKWLYVLTLCGVPIAALFLDVAYEITIISGIDWAVVMLISLGLFFIGIVLYGFYILPKMRALFSEGFFYYCNGLRVTVKIRLIDIKFVYLHSGNIVIDFGEKRKKSIPMYFSNSPKLVAMLKNYRP